MTRSRRLVVATILIWAALLLESRSSRLTAEGLVTGLHHVLMNVTDPERSAAFYTAAFPGTRRARLAGWQGVQAEPVYILFNTVASQASSAWDTPFWHFGWNTPNAVEDYGRIAQLGVRFFRIPPPSGHMVAPDGNDVEIAPASSGSGGRGPSAFNHVHLMSDAPLCAAAWYERVLGLRRAASDGPPPADCRVPFGPRRDPGNQIHQPSARLYAGDILVFIYPHQRLRALTQTAVDEEGPLVSPMGRVLERVGFTVADFDRAVAALEAERVVVLRKVAPFGTSMRRSILIEGPDHMVIELLERE